MTKSLHNPKCRGIIHFISSILFPFYFYMTASHFTFTKFLQFFFTESQFILSSIVHIFTSKTNIKRNLFYLKLDLINIVCLISALQLDGLYELKFYNLGIISILVLFFSLYLHQFSKYASIGVNYFASIAMWIYIDIYYDYNVKIIILISICYSLGFLCYICKCPKHSIFGYHELFHLIQTTCTLILVNDRIYTYI